MFAVLLSDTASSSLTLTPGVCDTDTQCVCAFTPDEELIRWGWPEDVWFHVDKVSSAHVYLRLKPVRLPARDDTEWAISICGSYNTQYK